MIRRGESAFAAVLIGFSAAALWIAYEIAGFSKWSSPGVFPMLASAIMLVCAVFILRDIRCQRRKRAQHVSADHTLDTSAVLPARVAVVTVLLALYILAMPTLGFLLDSGLFLIASIGYLWKKPLWVSVSVSLLALAVIHVVFRLVFQVILPQGTLVNLYF